jgi:hypothetical protein
VSSKGSVFALLLLLLLLLLRHSAKTETLSKN